MIHPCMQKVMSETVNVMSRAAIGICATALGVAASYLDRVEQWLRIGGLAIGLCASGLTCAYLWRKINGRKK